jgi:hypothetical protein
MVLDPRHHDLGSKINIMSVLCIALEGGGARVLPDDDFAAALARRLARSAGPGLNFDTFRLGQPRPERRSSAR